MGGSTDPLHLASHALSPLDYPAEGIAPNTHWPVPIESTDHTTAPRMAIITNHYAAWHATLWHYRPTTAPNGRSIRTDIVCKPLGWLGEYRYSTQTGAWFRGRHRCHLLGH